jgi:hypothetical protein
MQWLSFEMFCQFLHQAILLSSTKTSEKNFEEKIKNCLGLKCFILYLKNRGLLGQASEISLNVPISSEEEINFSQVLN